MNRNSTSADQSKEFDNTSIAQQNRTSFLIEDILYRQQSDDKDVNNVLDKSYDTSAAASASYKGEKVFQMPNSKLLDKRPDKNSYGYFQPSNLVPNGGGGCVQSFQQTDNGYIQVMGALGAYLGTPYKTITDPYFLAQGKSDFLSDCRR